MLEGAAVTATRDKPAATPAAPVADEAEAPAAPDVAEKKARATAPAAVQPLAVAAVATGPAPAPAPEPVAAPAAAPAAVPLAGRVLDEYGKPLVGATVMLKGSTKGTSTDASGNYTLDVPAGESTLTYGYGGYEDEVVQAHAGQPLNVTLTPRPDTKKHRRR